VIAEGFVNIIGEDSQFLEVLSVVRKIAPTDSTVIIYGESGTGKELIAETIHDNSLRRSLPFIRVNCGTISNDLQESKLFEYIKGALSGADKNSGGVFEQARGGTVFLDEIGKMELSVQATLLRFLDDRKIFHNGEQKPVDVRVICATSRDLKKLIAEKKFREDLYYRLTVISLNLPALRERKADIPALARFFCGKFAEKFGREEYSISSEALQALMDYHWPGNIRELRNVLERSAILAYGPAIGIDHFPKALNEPNGSLYDLIRDQPVLAELEKRYILHTLHGMRGNKAKACESLGISTTTLWRKLKEYGIANETATKEVKGS
jgi:transcriptional regulator with PAS, ATPase and Fis domain